MTNLKCKLFTLCVVAGILLSLSACSTDEVSVDTQTNEGTEINIESSSYDIDDSYLKVCFPSDFIYFESDEEINEYCDEMGYAGYVKNDDGSITFSMNETQYNEISAYMYDEVTNTFLSFINEIEYITAIDSNTDFTEITIRFTDGGSEEDKLYSAYEIGYLCDMYNRMFTTSNAEVKINFVADKTGEITDTITYSDLQNIVNSSSDLSFN